MNEEYKKLVEAIDTREKDKTDEESPEDWSNRVEKAISRGEENIKFQISVFKPLIPNPDYEEKKLQAYKDEVEKIGMQLSREIDEEDVNLIVQDILDSFDQDKSISRAEEAALSQAAEMGFSMPFSTVKKIENRELYEVNREKLLRTLLKKKDLHSVLQTIVELNENDTNFIEKDYVKDIFESIYIPAIKSNPRYWLLNFDRLARMPHRMEMLDIAVKETLKSTPTDVIIKYDTYKDKLPNAESYLKEALKICIRDKRGPESLAITFFTKHPELKFRKRFLMGMYEKYAYTNPKYYVENYAAFEGLPKADKLYEKAKILQYISPYNGNSGDKGNDGEELLKDPALRKLFDIKREWFGKLSDNEFANFATFICRNLYFKGQTVNQENSIREYESILKQREEYGNIPLFANRNILLVSHLEKYKTGKDRFGLQGLSDALEKQKGDNDKVFKHVEGTDYESLSTVKNEALLKLQNMKSPLTFIFDGHGGPDAIYLSDGQVKEMLESESENKNANTIIESNLTVKISYKELADAISKRPRNESGQKDIFIFSGCYNYEFMRNLYAELKRQGSDLPITLGESEYGQYAYSDERSNTGAKFFDKVLKVDSKESLIKDVWENNAETDSNPSLFIPSEKDKPLQISQAESQSSTA